MTREDIIRMAREAGFEADMFGRGIWDSSDFNRFAALVAAAEREACAKVAETHQYVAGWGVAAAIRKLGEVKP